MAKTATDIVVKQVTPLTIMDFEADAGAGFETATAAAFGVPFLAILQALSKRAKKSHSDYVPGAAPGMLCDTASNKVYDGAKGVTLIPVAYRQQLVEWRPRDDGGGKVAEHSADKMEQLTASVNDKGVPLTIAGNELRDTRVHYCLLVDDAGDVRPVVVSLTSSMIKASKLFMNAMNDRKGTRADGSKFTLPMYSGMFRLTVREKIDGDNSWFVPDFSFVGAVQDSQHVVAAREFKKVIDAGNVKVTGDEDDNSEKAQAAAPNATF